MRPTLLDLLAEATDQSGAAGLAIAAAIISPLLLFIGGVIGHRVARVGAKEQDDRAKREELLRSIRWAPELAIDERSQANVLGVAVLRELSALPLLQSDGDQAFIEAVIDAVVEEPLEVYRELEPGRTIEVELEPPRGDGEIT